MAAMVVGLAQAQSPLNSALVIPQRVPTLSGFAPALRGFLVSDRVGVSHMWKLGRLWAMFRKELLLAWAVLRDPRAPRAAKLATLLAVLYVVSPIDLVSDFIPVLGWLDDGIVAYLLLQLAFKFLPPDLMSALRSKVETRVRPVTR